MTYQTGHVGLHRRAHLQAGESLLVHAGAGGVGSAAIQLGKAAGARVIATAGGRRRSQVCRDLGADLVVDYIAEDFVAVVKEVTEGHGADVVYDPVGGDVFDKSRRCIAFEGRLVVVGFTSGRIPRCRPTTCWSRTTASSGCTGASTGSTPRGSGWCTRSRPACTRTARSTRWSGRRCRWRRPPGAGRAGDRRHRRQGRA